MKKLYYPKIAFDGIKKNGKLYFPYILTCVCMIAVFYIMQYIRSPECLEYLPLGKRMIPIFMAAGTVVMIIFSVIFLLYTNSFIARRRTKEFGLYNVLGMNKKNLARVMVWETLITALISISVGLFAGVLLSKFAELGLIRMLNGKVTFTIRLLPGQMLFTALVFLGIFALLLVISVIRVGKNNAINLMKTEAAGEKAPKANWLIGVLGIIVLCVAYYVAVKNSNGATAIGAFTIAVILVILATYMIFIAGSVLLCKILQKNKKYYYTANHFVSVSSMTFRMKRNGAGLASICIISTMVLVMLSSSSCLWFGCEESVKAQYPRDMRALLRFESISQYSEKACKGLDDAIDEACKDVGGATNIIVSKYIYMMSCLELNTADATYDRSRVPYTSSKLRDLYITSTDVYNTQTGENLVLADGEAVIIPEHCKYEYESFSVKYNNEIINLRVREVKKKTRIRTGVNDGSGRLTIIVNDPFKTFAAVADQGMSVYYCKDFNLGLYDDKDGETEEYAESLVHAEDVFYRYMDKLGLELSKSEGINTLHFGISSGNKDEFRYIYGGLFFLGIMLSLVFMLAAVLIIYYKQITEGYEDSKRFQIMQNVGMTKREIKKTINSQLLTVFFMPIAFAGLHLCFAFPIIRVILAAMELYNLELFTITTLASFVLFSLFYVIVYKSTSKAYYSIVSG